MWLTAFPRKFFGSGEKKTKEEETKGSDSDKKKKIRKINPRDKEFIDFIAGQIDSKNSSPDKKEKAEDKK